MLTVDANPWETTQSRVRSRVSRIHGLRLSLRLGIGDCGPRRSNVLADFIYGSPQWLRLRVTPAINNRIESSYRSLSAFVMEAWRLSWNMCLGWICGPNEATP